MAREQERDELHRTIWQIANDLRGSVDGWDFKSYVGFPQKLFKTSQSIDKQMLYVEKRYDI